MNGNEILPIARPHIGETYRLGAVVRYDDAACRGPWDCAEFATWCAFQAYRFLYGCDASGTPGSAYTGTWRTHANAKGRRIGVSEATRIPGAFLLRYPSGGGIGHIAISAGDGTTIEAADRTRGVIAGTAAGRRWDTGVLLPGVEYPEAGAVLPPVVHAEPLPERDERVVEIQLALQAKGFDPGPIDGLFGERTAEAVAAFQAANGLIVDGEVGPQTAALLLGARAAPAAGADAPPGPAAAAPAGAGPAAAPGPAPATPALSSKYEDLAGEYLALFAALTQVPAKAAEIALATRRVLAGRARYESVAQRLGAIPWYVVGVINELESTSNFATHLHNGDPLTARTRRVPAGHPKAGQPPFTWEESAEDALRLKGYHTMADWRLSRILHRLEGYNGWGSRRHGVHTPYLWSGCQHYRRGKYVADGVWDPNAVSRQIGCAVLLHELEARGEIALDRR